ncbi:hypothetical protein [Sabulicella rubraurantiaca]|uniref:hypothetical protein n=1 Tax=Sabulicella rubraurantiaca TaxID=2811429 RepID=UPI001A9583E1|nr:hypothetical protein [Sabulicella rubraurantiaca]
MTLDTCPLPNALSTPARHISSIVEALCEIERASMAGATVCWIRATADDALEAASLLRVGGYNPILLQADPAAEANGAFATDKARSGAQILVTTPDMAALLALECDLVISDTAPKALRASGEAIAARMEKDLSHSAAVVPQLEPALA